MSNSQSQAQFPTAVRLREFKNKGKVSIVRSHGRLQECPLTGMSKYSVCMEVQTGFVKAVVNRAVCFGEFPLKEPPLY